MTVLSYEISENSLFCGGKKKSAFQFYYSKNNNQASKTLSDSAV